RPYDVTFRIRRPVDGELADIRSLAEYDRERNVMFGVLQDITAQKQAETALRESEARLRAIFDSAQDYIFLKDRELRYTHVNQACQELLRRPMAEIVGRTDAELFPPQYVEQIQATDRRVLAGEATRDVYERRLNDETAVVETIKVPVCNDAGEVVGICGVSRDITEVRRLEERLQQAQKMEAVGRLAGGVAHDFNNLLTPILGFADLLLHSHAEDDPRRKDLRAITRAAERARDLTAQLLAFGRKQVLDMKVVDLNDVVRESEPMLRRLLRENIQLNLVLAPALGAVRADVSQLHNVLINLVVNAADAMRDGGTLGIETQNVELDTEYIRAHPGSRPGPHVLLAVSDDGCGMDPETLSIVFEPFFTTKDAHEGTGLGLSTVLGIVQQHQGSITVYSEPKHGSVFKVYLPRVDARPATLPAGGETRPLYGSERVLLVEDDDAVRGLTAAALAKYGYTVVPAATPAAALELLADGIQPCDLLITDVVMPGMNGAQLHRALLGAWSRLPALFISGYTSDIIAHHGILAEGLHYLQKPFTPRDLAAKARQVLDG
ncbi:MAG: PAS domain-containing protein, partial [Candidatus Krumholzibacteria bacterium]|nr:PAS domain-containing protein [Candidatus Krumholzibacteria bacterium]